MESRFRQLKPNVSEKTIQVYASNLRRLRKVSPSLEYAAISEYLKQMKPQNAANLLTCVIVYEGRERFGELFDTFNEEAEKMRGSQRFTERELDSWVTVRKYREGIRRCFFDVDRLNLLQARKHKPTELVILVGYLMMRFYQEFHWRSDLRTIRIGKHDNDNFYHNGKFYLNKFKTARKFKHHDLLPVIYTPSPRLRSLIEKFIKVREKQDINHDYLIYNRNLQPMSQTSFYKTMTRITFKYVGKKLSSSMLRHIYATEIMSKNPSLQEKKQHARSFMQLQVEMFESYARRDENGKLAS